MMLPFVDYQQTLLLSLNISMSLYDIFDFQTNQARK